VRLRDAALHPCAERPRLLPCRVHLLAERSVGFAEPPQFRFRLRDELFLLVFKNFLYFAGNYTRESE